MSFAPETTTTPAEAAAAVMQQFKLMRHGITSVARAMTRNPKLVVELSTSGSTWTDGKVMYVAATADFGVRYDHSPLLCDRRDEGLQMMCPECARRDGIYSLIYHEMAHCIYGSLDEPPAMEVMHGDWIKSVTWHDAIGRAAIVTGLARDRDQWDVEGGLLEVALRIGKFMRTFLNALEDIRIERALGREREGVPDMMRARNLRLVSPGNPSYLDYRDAPLNFQIIMGAIMKFDSTHTEPTTDTFAPRIVDEVNAPEFVGFSSIVDEATGAFDLLKRAIPFYAYLISRGFFEQPPAPEPEPEPEPEPQEEESTDDPQDEAGEAEEAPDDSGDGSGSDEGDPNGGEQPDDSEEEADSSDGDGGEPSDSEGSDPGDDAGVPADVPDDARDDAGPDGSTDGGDDDADGEPGGASDEGEPEGGSEGGSGSDSEGEPGEGGDEPSQPGEREGDVPDDPTGGMEPGEEQAGEGEGGEPESDAGAEAGPDAPGDDNVSPEGGEESSSGPSEGGSGEPGDGSGAGQGGEPEPVPEGDPFTDETSPSTDRGEGSAEVGGDELPGGEHSSGDEVEREGREGSGESSDAVPELPDAAPDLGDGTGEPSDADESDGEGEPASVDTSDAGDSGPDAQPGNVEESSPGGAGAGLGPSTEEEMGDAETVAEEIDKFLGHDGRDHAEVERDETELIDPKVASNLKDLLTKPDEFEKVGRRVKSLTHMYYEHNRGLHGSWVRKQTRTGGANGPRRPVTDRQIVSEIAPTQEQLGRATAQLRIVLAENKRTGRVRNLRSGKVDGRVLGKRAALGDDRLFHKRQRPAKRDYFVVIHMDLSGSTNHEIGGRWPQPGIRVMTFQKMAVFAQAELLHRLGIPFVILGSTGDLDGQLDRYREDYPLQLLTYHVKDENQPWDDKAKQRLANLPIVAANLDGHQLQMCLHIAMQNKATDKIIMYYTDGKMPMENFEEELEVLQGVVSLAKRKEITLMAVGIETDSPRAHGLDTVQINSPHDLVRVVEHLRDRLMS